MVKIRLRRVGAKKQPSYRIVVADSRSPRDGRFIENIGNYDPRTDPPTVVVKEERALYWLSVGAQPTDAVARFFAKLDLPAKLKKVHGGAKIDDLVAAPAATEPAAAEPKRVVEKAKAVVEEVEEEVAETIEEAKEAVAELVEDVKEEAAELVEDVKEVLEDAEVAVLELSTRVANALEAAEVKTLSQLRELRAQGKSALTALAGIGDKAADEIVEKLDEHDGEAG